MSTQSDQTERRYWLPSELAKHIHASPAHVRRLCAAGVIRSVVVSPRGDRRIPDVEVRRIDALTASGGSIFDRSGT
jgi:hypothetical protein